MVRYYLNIEESNNIGWRSEVGREKCISSCQKNVYSNPAYMDFLNTLKKKAYPSFLNNHDINDNYIRVERKFLPHLYFYYEACMTNQ